MFLKVSKSYFFNILTKFIKIIDQNNPTPMLSGIYMHATHDLLTLTGADGSSVVQIAVNNHEQCQMIEPGIALIKIKFLFEIMKTIDDEMIDIRLHHNALLINGVDFNLNLCLMNAAEYPILFSADYETAVPITVAYETLENLDSKLCFHEKDGMKGVNFSYRSPTLDISWSDAFRIAIQKTTNLPTELASFSVLVPFKIIKELTNIFEQSPIDIYLLDNIMYFIQNNIKVMSTLITTDCWDTSVIATSNIQTTVMIKTKPLLKSLLRANALFKDSDYRIIEINITLAGFVIKSQLTQVGESYDLIKAIQLQGCEQKLLTNSLALLATIQSFQKSPTICLKITDHNRSMHITAPDIADLQHFVLPLKQ